MDNWATNQLSVFLGFDDETIKTQVLPYLYTLETPEALKNHLTDMLGNTYEVREFANEFATRRFAEQSRRVQEQQPPPQQQSFPALPSTSSASTEWPSNTNVYVKKDTEGDYFPGAQKGKKSSKQKAAGTLISEKKKKKPKNEMTLETALKELDIKATEGSGKRQACQCQATKHPLLTIAPNCLNCGKIICTLEGPGPCTFCGTPVLSKEQQVALIVEAKRKRAEQKQKMHEQMQRRSKSASPSTPAVGYAAKVSGEIIQRRWDYYEEENRRKAEAHKEKLLEFQRTSAKRTTVIDQAADFTLPTDVSNPWLTPQERALQMKKQQANLKKLQSVDQPRRRVMTIDIQSRQVTLEDASSSESEPEPEEIPVETERPEGTGTFAKNPLLKGLSAPKFIGKQHSNKKGGKSSKRKERIQYDDFDLYGDYQYALSIADEKDTIEPACG